MARARSRAAADHEAAREAVLGAALAHVPFDGWSRRALEAGARDAGYAPTMALRAFPGGAIEAIEAHSASADRRMIVALAARDLEGLRVRERIALAVRLRLTEHTGAREAIRRAVAVLALPVYAPVGLACLYRTVDAIWYAAGDRATDFNFYTKRALLAGVYGATLVHWLDDRSEGAADSWAFLERCIDAIMRIPRIQDRARRAAGRIARLLPRMRTRTVRMD